MWFTQTDTSDISGHSPQSRRHCPSYYTQDYIIVHQNAFTYVEVKQYLYDRNIDQNIYITLYQAACVHENIYASFGDLLQGTDFTVHKPHPLHARACVLWRVVA